MLTGMLSLLCTPALAVHKFRPTLLRPRAPHLRTAALRPACIALDPDLQPVDEAVTGFSKLPEIPDVIVLSAEVEGASEAPQFTLVGPPGQDFPFIVDFPPMKQEPEVGDREPVQDFLEGVVKEFIQDSPTMFLDDPPTITPPTMFLDDPPTPEGSPLGEEATRLAKIEKAKHPLPSTGELMRFCLPTLGIWLAPPFLSLIDTSVVGMHCSISSLAALAPSTKLCDYLSYMCTALGVATTNIAAERFAQNEPEQAKRVVGGSMTIALVVGVALAASVRLAALPVLRAMIGPAMANGPVLAAATEYTVIRALGFPAALLTLVLQAGFLASKDPFSPLLAVPLSALTNLALDLWLVGSLGLGTAGAAWGTVASLYVNGFTLLAMWHLKARTLGEATPLFTLPSSAEMRRLLVFIVPMLVALCSRVSMGLSITLSATALGTVALASNQVVESVYWLFCPIGEAISLCMQTYMPSVLASRRRAGAQMRAMCERASLGAGLVAGAAAGLAVVIRPGLFTTSGAVAGSMARTAPLLAASIFTFARMCGLEGIMIARKQMKQLAITHAVLAVVLIAALRRATRTAGCGLEHVWGLIALLNAARHVIFRQTVLRSEAAEALEEAAGIAQVVPNIAETHPHML